MTRDMDDAATLRQTDLVSQNTARAAAQQETARQEAAARQTSAQHLVSGQFHSTTLDTPVVRTALPENIVSRAAAPVLYPVYVTSGRRQIVNSQTQGRATANMVLPRAQAKRPTGTSLTNGQ